MKRVSPVVGVNSTFIGSPRTAAASARQTATSKPSHWPAASGAAKPARPVLTPHFSVPRAFTSSSVAPDAAPAARARAIALPKRNVCFMSSSSCWAAAMRRRGSGGGLTPICVSPRASSTAPALSLEGRIRKVKPDGNGSLTNGRRQSGALLGNSAACRALGRLSGEERRRRAACEEAGAADGGGRLGLGVEAPLLGLPGLVDARELPGLGGVERAAAGPRGRGRASPRARRGRAGRRARRRPRPATAGPEGGEARGAAGAGASPRVTARSGAPSAPPCPEEPGVPARRPAAPPAPRGPRRGSREDRWRRTRRSRRRRPRAGARRGRWRSWRAG